MENNTLCLSQKLPTSSYSSGAQPNGGGVAVPSHTESPICTTIRSTYGGWGRTVYGKLDEEYERRKKEEKAEGKSGWAAYRWKRALLERMSIAIAKGNWALLDAHTPVRPVGAAA